MPAIVLSDYAFDHVEHYASLKAMPKALDNLLLQRVFESDLPKGTVMKITGDTNTESAYSNDFVPTKGTRAFVSINNKKLDELITNTQINLHEVVRGNVPRRLFFDIDLESEKLKQMEDDQDVMSWLSKFGYDIDTPNNLMEAFRDCIQEVGSALGCGHLDIEVFTRHRKGKYSFHLIVMNYYVENSNQQKKFNYLLRHAVGIPAMLYTSGIIDELHKTTQNFALPLCFNKGYQLIHWLNETDVSASDYLVSVFNRNVEVVPKLAGIATLEVQQQTPIEDSLVQELHQTFVETCPDLANDWRFNKAKGAFLNYSRVRASHCDICDKVHQKDNTLYLLYLDNERGKVLVRGCSKTKGTLKHVKTLEEVILPSKDEAFKTLLDETEPTNNDTFTNCKVDTYQSIELKPIEFVKDTNEIDVFAMKAQKGLGKTKNLIQYMETLPESSTIGCISFRKTLTANVLGRFNAAGLGFVSYLDPSIRGTITTPRWICQVESLPRLSAQSVQVDLLVIDEINQVFNQLFSSTNGSAVAAVFARMQTLFTLAKRIIIIDADINSETINKIKLLRPDANVLVSNNTYAKPYDVEITNCMDTLRMKLFQDVADGKKCVVATNYGHKKNAELVKAIGDALTKFIPLRKGQSKSEHAEIIKAKKDKIMLYTRETSKCKDVKATLNDVNLTWKNYDCIVYSPTIQSGVSFEQEHFDECYAFFNNLTNTHQDCSQMLQRVRNLSGKIHVCIIQKNIASFPTNEAGIMEVIKQNREQLFIPTSIDRVETVSENKFKYEFPNQNTFFKLWIKHVAESRQSRQDFTKLFIAHEKASGAKVNALQSAEKKEVKREEQRRKLALKELSNEERHQVLQAKDIDISELNEATEPEIKRHTLRQYYDYEGTIDMDWIETYDDSKAKKVFKNLCEVSEGLEALRVEQMNEFEQRNKNDSEMKDTEMINEYSYSKHKIADELIQLIGFTNIYDTETTISIADYMDNLSKVKSYLKKNSKFICGIFGKTKPKLENWDLNISLRWLSPIYSGMYGAQLSSASARKQKATHVSLKHNFLGKIFHTSKLTDDTIVVKKQFCQFDDIEDDEY